MLMQLWPYRIRCFDLEGGLSWWLSKGAVPVGANPCMCLGVDALCQYIAGRGPAPVPKRVQGDNLQQLQVVR